NKHCSIVKLIPQLELYDYSEKKTKDELENRKSLLSDDEIDKILLKNELLYKYHEIVSNEKPGVIQGLKINNINSIPNKFHNYLRTVSGVKVLHQKLSTGGIAYIKFMFKI